MRSSFNCLNLLVTNQCPSKCAHCAYHSGPDRQGSLDLDLFMSLLNEAEASGCQVVNFSGGGDPFMLGSCVVNNYTQAQNLAMPYVI